MRSILRSPWLRAAVLACLLGALCLSAAASSAPPTAAVAATNVETLYSAEYCFCEADFHADTLTDLNGIFVTGVPDKTVAAVRLGNREILPGDVLPLDCLSRLTLQPNCAGGCDAVMTYCPIRGTRLDSQATLTIRIKSGKNEPPKAVDTDFETYKNVANDGQLTGTDPENAPLTFQLVDEPKRGTVDVAGDGTVTYTPTENKVGKDSFTYTVTDPAGNVSEEATVRIRILKPSDKETYQDMDGDPAELAAMWMKETGLYRGNSVAGELLFSPDETVTRGEFTAMCVALTQAQPELLETGFIDGDDMPLWLQPYVGAALKCGYLSGIPTENGLAMEASDPIRQRRRLFSGRRKQRFKTYNILCHSGPSRLQERTFHFPQPTKCIVFIIAQKRKK